MASMTWVYNFCQMSIYSFFGLFVYPSVCPPVLCLSFVHEFVDKKVL